MTLLDKIIKIRRRMIRKFGFTNFTSFKESVEVNFELDGKTPEYISNGDPISTVMGIKGANGSGKTNILRALAFLSYFCITGAREIIKGKDNQRRSSVAVESFFGNPDDTEFFVDFEKNGTEFTYELNINNGVITREYIARRSQRTVVLLERKFNDITDSISNFSEFNNFELKEDTSVLEMLTQYKFKNDISELMTVRDFFYQMIVNVNIDGYHEMDFDLYQECETLFDYPYRYEFLKEFLTSADLSLKDISIEVGRDTEGNEVHYPVFHHYVDNETTKALSFSQQSDGTKKLFSILGSYFTVLETGGILVLDEFDIHLHAKILPLIVNLFLNKKINPLGAQFIFTSHNTEIIDSLSKYRTFLVNKEESESFGYRLDEIPGSMIRNDRPITPLYVDGKLGGIPLFRESRIEELMHKRHTGETYGS
ncbi:AAA family ATPase [Vibrio fortis]|uniref:AAA family ATPase n=1 Tax=Vibrio fortis TaxID=212667 RepID=A0A5N3SAL9_9VIBR|nr:ATP-binding protein [Vibrio fortis]KAB0303894.1 AAA family ATPase [Vibrio fortis]